MELLAAMLLDRKAIGKKNISEIRFFHLNGFVLTLLTLAASNTGSYLQTEVVHCLREKCKIK